MYWAHDVREADALTAPRISYQIRSVAMYVGTLFYTVPLHKQEYMFMKYEYGHVNFIHSQIVCQSNKLDENKSTQLC